MDEDSTIVEYHKQYCKELLEFHKNKQKLYYLANRDKILQKQKTISGIINFLKIKNNQIHYSIHHSNQLKYDKWQ